MKLTQRHILVIIALLCSLFIVNSLYHSQKRTMPDITFTDIDQKQHTLSDYHGKPILVTFWATDCPSCIGEIPTLIKLYNDFYAQGLTMLAIAMPHDTEQRITTMRINKKLPYLIAWDKNAAMSLAFGHVRVTPTHFLISPNGKIVMRKIGDLNIDYLYKKLADMGLTISSS